MRKTAFAAMTLAALLALAPRPADAWGRKAHETVARSAVQGLPDGMKAFFVTCAEYLAMHAEDPDNWREHNPAEGYRHYIDFELLPREDWSALPSSLKDAEEKYGAEKMQKVGVLPWRIAEMTDALAAQMRDGRWDEAKITAAALSHYVADAHQPLHCTLNYDGRDTGNDGIHGRFEIEMADRYIVTPLVPVKPAAEVEDVFAAALAVCLESNRLLDGILQADTAARAAAPLDSPAYYLALAERCGDLARRRIAASAQVTAALWHTAWVRAGRPEMPTKRATVVIYDAGLVRRFSEHGLEHLPWSPPLITSGGPHDAYAARLIGDKENWSRGIRWQHMGSDKQGAWTAPRRTGWSDEGMPGKEEPDPSAVSFTPSVSMGCLEAVEQLSALPGTERKIVVCSNGLGDEKRFDPEVIAKAVKRANVTVKVHAYGKDAAADTNLQALCKALGVELQVIFGVTNAP